MKSKLFFAIFLLILWGCDTRYPSPNWNNYPSRTYPVPPQDSSTVFLATYSILKTAYSLDLDYWNIYSGDSLVGWIKTYYSDDWDGWKFKYFDHSGYFETLTSEDWDDWIFVFDSTFYYISTVYSNDWSYWKIYKGNDYLTAYIPYSDEWDFWEIYNANKTIYLETRTTEEWEYWKVYADTSFYITDADIMLTHFFAIFTSSIFINGVIQEE